MLISSPLDRDGHGLGKAFARFARAFPNHRITISFAFMFHKIFHFRAVPKSYNTPHRQTNFFILSIFFNLTVYMGKFRHEPVLKLFSFLKRIISNPSNLKTDHQVRQQF